MNPIYSPFFQLFRVRGAILLPTLVCVWYLVKFWREGELYGVQEIAFFLCFAVSLLIVLFSQSTGVWIAGFVAQVALAIALVFKNLIDNDVT
jgi:hypothetical protein